MENEKLSEKVSVNISSSVLSGIDLLVDHGYYSNRSDFINQALYASLDKHSKTLDRIEAQIASEKDGWFFGVYVIGKKEIEEKFQKGERFSVKGYGVLRIAEDVPEEMLFSVVDSITLKGKACASETVKKYYGIK